MVGLVKRLSRKFVVLESRVQLPYPTPKEKTPLSDYSDGGVLFFITVYFCWKKLVILSIHPKKHAVFQEKDLAQP